MAFKHSLLMAVIIAIFFNIASAMMEEGEHSSFVTHSMALKDDSAVPAYVTDMQELGAPTMKQRSENMSRVSKFDCDNDNHYLTSLVRSDEFNRDRPEIIAGLMRKNKLELEYGKLETIPLDSVSLSKFYLEKCKEKETFDVSALSKMLSESPAFSSYTSSLKTRCAFEPELFAKKIKLKPLLLESCESSSKTGSSCGVAIQTARRPLAVPVYEMAPGFDGLWYPIGFPIGYVLHH